MIKALNEKFGFTNWSLLSFVTFLAGCLALIPQSIIIPPGTGTDFSYMQALNWIWSHGLDLKFGSDIVYPYGPLGFLCYKIAGNWQHFFCILFFEIYIYFNFVFILKAFIPDKPVLSLLAILSAIFFFDHQATESGYYLIFIFSIFSFLKNDKPAYVINAAVITVFSFFIKTNFGIVQSILFFGFIFYSLIFRKANSRLLVTIALAAIISVVALSYALGVQMGAYIANSLEVISGYNDAMVIPVSIALKRFQFAVITLIVYNGIALFYLSKNRFKTDEMLRWFLTALYIFIVFKYSFVRADLTKTPHSFFVFIVVAIGIHYLFEEGAYKRRLTDLACVNFFFAGTVFLCLNPFTGKSEILQSLSVDFFKDLAGGAKAKFTVSKQIKQSRLIPERILNKIGNKSVDLMPYNLSLLFINDLNYCPRPTLQSYAAFTLSLDLMNCRKYISNTAPEFVLFSSGSIDNRVPFWDEAATHRALLQYYQVIDSFSVNDAYENGYNSGNSDIEKYLLFERNKTPLSVAVKKQVSGKLILNEPFYVDTGISPQYLYADIKYSLAGRVKSFLFQPSLINVIFYYETGKTDTLRAVRPILKTGVLINKEVTNIEAAETFYKTDGAGNGKVIWIKFVPADNFSYKREVLFHADIISYE